MSITKKRAVLLTCWISWGVIGMTLNELERQLNMLKARPLVLLCRTPTGREQTMSVERCMETGSTFIRVVLDDLDEFLARELGNPSKKG